MKLTPNLKNTLQNIGVFLLYFSIFLSAQFCIKGFMSPDDPYYHARHSAIIAEQHAFSVVEPWIAFHTLSASGVDPYLLHHFIASLFIKYFGIISGYKIFSALLATLVFYFLYLIFKKNRIQQPLLWSLVAFSSSSIFIFRVLLERPYVGAIAFTLLGLYFLLEKKYIWLFLLNIFSILFYNLAILFLFPVLIDLLVQYLVKKEINLKPLIATTAGLLFGVILHPQTLGYIFLIYNHFFQIFYFKLIGISLTVGAEIKFQGILYTIKNNFLAIAVYLVAISLYFSFATDLKKYSRLFFFFLLSFFWFVISLFYPRGAEYFVPFGWLFVVLTFSEAKKSGVFNAIDLKLGAKTILKRTVFAGIFFLIAFAGFCQIAIVLKLVIIHNQKDELSAYQEASEYLIKNTPKDSIVYHPIWDMATRLFYFNTHNRYVAANDPIFSYNYSPQYYWIMTNLGRTGTYCAQADPCFELSAKKQLEILPIAFHYIFETDTIIIPHKINKNLYLILENQKQNFTRVFQNDELTIYRVITKQKTLR